MFSAIVARNTLVSSRPILGSLAPCITENDIQTALLAHLGAKLADRNLIYRTLTEPCSSGTSPIPRTMGSGSIG